MWQPDAWSAGMIRHVLPAAALLSVSMAVSAQDLTTLRGQYGFGNPSALAVDAAGTRAYVGESAALSILDLTVLADPLPPSAVLARFPVDAPVEHLELDEAHARLLIAGGSYGLLSIDLASPGHALSRHDDPGDLVCLDVELAEQHVLAVFAAKDASQLRVYDRVDLELVSTADLVPGTAFAVAADGTLAYVAMGTGGLARVDFDDPAAPLVEPGPVLPIGVFDEPGRVRDVCVSEGRLYAAADGLGVVSIAVTSPWSPDADYQVLGLQGLTATGQPAVLYAHRIAAVGPLIHVGANRSAGREMDGGPFTSYGSMDFMLKVGGVVTPGPLAAADALVLCLATPSGGLSVVGQFEVPAPWRALVSRADRLYHVQALTGTMIRPADDLAEILATYRPAVSFPSEALFSLRDPDLLLCGQDGSGPAYAGLLDIGDPDDITPVPGTAGLGSLGLWFDAQWLDGDPQREWLVGGGADGWRLLRMDAGHPAQAVSWSLQAPDDPEPGVNNGRNYWLSWLDGDLLLLTRGGTTWGLVGYSRSAVQAEALANPQGASLATPPLWQVQTHLPDEQDQSLTWRCRTTVLPSGQRLAAVAAGCHTSAGPDFGRPQVMLFELGPDPRTPPALLSRILGPNTEGNAMAVAFAAHGGRTLLFVVDFGYGLHVYDVSEPADAVRVGGWAAPPHPFDGVADHPTDLELVTDAGTGALHVYLTLWRRGLVVLDASEPDGVELPVIEIVDTPGVPYGIAVRDVLGSRGLLLADHQFGLRLYGHFARWEELGGGCAGSGPPPTLTAQNAPVLGATYALQVAGLTDGNAIMVTGFGPANLPLQPLGHGFGPGCTLLVLPHLLTPLFPTGGVATWSAHVPGNPALVGWKVYNQVAVLGKPSALSNAGVGTID